MPSSPRLIITLPEVERDQLRQLTAIANGGPRPHKYSEAEVVRVLIRRAAASAHLTQPAKPKTLAQPSDGEHQRANDHDQPVTG